MISFQDIPNKVIIFIREIRQEIKKVNWPTRAETARYTLIVIGASFVTALFLGGLDFMFRWLLEKFVI